MTKIQPPQVLADLAPGFHHRGLARAGRLAQKRPEGPASSEPATSANVAWGHFTDPSEDYIGKQALRELLRKMWALRPDLHPRLWECACKTVGADHWQRVLREICREHELGSIGKEETLPLSGGRSAVFRVGRNVVKVFVSSGAPEGDGSVATEGRAKQGAGESNGAQGGSLTRNGLVCNQGGAADGASEQSKGDGSIVDSGLLRKSGGANDGNNGKGELGYCPNGVGSVRSEEGADPEDAKKRGRDQAEMYRTEVIMHELIRTSKSSLTEVVPQLVGYGVLVEEDNGSPALERSFLVEVEKNDLLANGIHKHAAKSKQSVESLEGSERVCKKGRAKDAAENAALGSGGLENGSGLTDERRRWMYVVTAECEGTQLSEVSVHRVIFSFFPFLFTFRREVHRVNEFTD